MAKIVGKEEIASSRWLRFVNLKYQLDESGPVREWQACERSTTEPGGVDAVAVFAVVKSKSAEPRLLIVKQFRPPIGKLTVELCAGLVDPGESVETSAMRELKEETGYVGKVVGTTGRQYLSPGLTSENIVTVFAEIDLDHPDNANPKPCEDDMGAITMDTLPINGLYEALQELEKEGFAIWVGLWTIAQGMRLNSLMSLSS